MFLKALPFERILTVLVFAFTNPLKKQSFGVLYTSGSFALPPDSIMCSNTLQKVKSSKTTINIHLGVLQSPPSRDASVVFLLCSL